MTMSKAPSANKGSIYTEEAGSDAKCPRTTPDRRDHDRRLSKPQLLSSNTIRSLRQLDDNTPLILRISCRRQNTRRDSKPKPFSLLEADNLRKNN